MANNELSHLGTLCFDEGILGFKLIKEDGKYGIGDQLLFYPCMSVDQYSISNTKERCLKHILYDIYEFTFKPIAKYQHNDQPEGYYKYKDLNHYLLEVLPGFNVFHFNWTKVHKDYLQIGKLYRGYGRLSTCDNPALYNPKIDAKAIKRIRCKGVLEKIQVNLICKDFGENYCADSKKVTRDAIYGEKGTISYEDALKNIGYPENELKFRVNVSMYKDKCLNLKKTLHNGKERLVYCIKMK
jgi:hypothetical protein